MYYIIGILIIGVAVVYALCETAPVGYQDETGFHYGEEPRK